MLFSKSVLGDIADLAPFELRVAQLWRSSWRRKNPGACQMSRLLVTRLLWRGRGTMRSRRRCCLVITRHALESALAPGTWQLDPVRVPARWIVYMGKFASAEGLSKKKEELFAMRLTPQSLINPALEIGLSLGAFDSQEAANAELAKLNLRGIRTARVVQEYPEGQQTQLKLPALTNELKVRLNDIKAALAGKSLHNCN